jgi:diacylglycerol kinase (ATP)
VAEKVLLVLNEKAGSFEPGFRAYCKGQASNLCIGTKDDIPRETWDVVVAGGGDGTVHTVVNALIAQKSEARLGIVPLGTANVISRALGLPSDPKEALSIALGREEKCVDVGFCHGDAFLLGCGLGLAERFVTQAGDREKARLGPLAYLKRLIAERDAPMVEFCVESEKGSLRLQGVGLVVANLAQLGPHLKPVEEVSPDDGQLGLIVLKRSSLLDFMRIGLRGLIGKASEDDALDVILTSKCRVSSQPKVPIQIDGDQVEQTSPFEFDVLPQRLWVRVPAPSSGHA